MRTALLAAVRRTTTGQLRAELELGGRSVLAWQVELVRALGCVRIICLCEAVGGEVLALQKRVETEGGTFHAIRSNTQLASLVRADDQLVMMLDGLVADRSTVMARAGLAEPSSGSIGRGIATIPADNPLAVDHPDDFERIDRERHWAGFAVMRASHVHTLADLPPDSEPMSLLLRLGLQARVEMRDIPPVALDSGGWMLATDDEALVEREIALVESSVGVPPWSGPGRALAATLVRRIGPRWLTNGSEISALLSIGLLLAGAGLAASGLAIWGLAMAAIAAFAGSLSEAWGKMRAALWSEDGGARLRRISALATDILAAIALTLANGPLPAQLVPVALPLVAIGLARYLAGGSDGVMSAFWRDRFTHLVFFAVSAGFEVLNEALALFALGAVVQLLLRGRGN